MDEITQGIINLAPAIWDAAMRQVHIQVAIAAVTLILWVGLSVYLFMTARELHSMPDDPGVYPQDHDLFAAVAYVAAALVVLLALYSLSDLIPRLLNPSYYAIRTLLGGS